MPAINPEPSITSSTFDVNKTSLAVKAFVASLLPIVHLLIPSLTIVSEQVDKGIDAVFLLISMGIAIYGYFRSKNALQAQVVALGGRLKDTKDYARNPRS